MGDYYGSHTEVSSLNKPVLFQLKRVLRAVKRMENQDKPVKQGAFLQVVRKAPGSAVTNEKIVHDIFGKDQVLSPLEFKKRLFKYEIEPGAKFYVKPETAYQTTQRLIPNEKTNKTIVSSIYSEVYEKILNKFKDRPDGDNIIRKINRNLASHFSNAAAFIRYTHMSSRWIHIDAYQTDFFNQLKAIAFKESEMKEVVEEFRKHEFEFFKAAFSYIVRSNPGVKVWTSNTESLAREIEHVQGDVKLKEYYYKLPKDLGFKLIPIGKLYTILGNRPGKETDKVKKIFGDALSKKEIFEVGDIDDDYFYIISNIIKDISENKNLIEDGEKLDHIFANGIQKRLEGDRDKIILFGTAFHQLLDPLRNLIQNLKIEKKTHAKIMAEVKKFFDDKRGKVVDMIKEKIESSGKTKKIFWADRRMLFENKLSTPLNKFLAEMVK